MMELENEFKVEDGIIKNPGKFEGETLATPYFYDAFLNGEENPIKISDEDRVILGDDIDESDDYVNVRRCRKG